MNNLPVVFFDTSVLIAGSIGGIDPKIKHERYEVCIQLIRQSQKTIIGVTTYDIEDEAMYILEKVVKDEYEKNSQSNDFDYFSDILNSVNKKFYDNIRILDRLGILKNTELDTLIKELSELFDELESKVLKKPTMAYTDDKKFKGVARDVSDAMWDNYCKMKRRVQRKGGFKPEYSDVNIMAQAIILKRNRFKSEIFFLASIDNHFVGLREPFEVIPKALEEKYKLKCLPPNKILSLIGK